MKLEIPQVLQDIPEIMLIHRQGDVQNESFCLNLEVVEKDLHLDTATTSGIARLEKVLNIRALDTDDIESRRFRIKNKINEKLPYTIRILQKRLNSLCGSDGYELEVDIVNQSVTCRIQLSKKQMFNEVYNMLEEVLPLNFTIDLMILYNTWNKISKYKWNELNTMTWLEVREAILNDKF